MISSEHIVDQLKRGVEWGVLRQESWQASDVGILVEAIRQQLHVDPKMAEQLSDTADKVAEILGDPCALAEAKVGEALVLRNAGAFGEALARLDEAMASSEHLEDGAQAAKAGAERVRTLMFLGRYPEAMATCDQMRPLLTEKIDKARLDGNAGIVLAKMGQFQEAKTKLNEAIELFGQIGRSGEAALSQANLATVHLSTDEIEAAKTLFARCTSLFEQEGMHVALAKVGLERSFFSERMGRFDEALKLLQDGEARFTELGMRAEAAIAQLHAAEVYLSLNLVEEAVTYARKASGVFETLGMRYNLTLSRAVEAKTLGRAGRIPEAQEILAACRTTFEDLGVQTQVAEVDWDLSQLALASGDLREAMETAQSAQRVFSREGLVANRLRADLNIAEIRRRWGWNGPMQKMWENMLEEAGQRHLEEIACQAEYGLGKVHESKKNAEEALVWYLRAIERLERMRALLGIEAHRISFAENRMNLYEDAVALCLEQGNVEQAFELVERSKSRTLVDVLADRAAGHMDPDRLRSLREQLTYLHEKAHTAREGEEAGQTHNRGQRIAQIEQLLLGPEETRVHSSDRALSLKATQQLIGPDTVVLEYYQVPGNLMAFIVRHDRCNVIELSVASDQIERALLRWEFAIEQFDLGEKTAATHQDQWAESATHHLAELYDLLIRPVRKQLDETTRWIVVPHGLLHKVPFHALWDGHAYVNETIDLSYAPSLSVLSHCLRGKTGRRESERVGGFPSPLPTLSSSPPDDGDERRALVMGVPDARMPRVEEEALGVGRALSGAEVLLGGQATILALCERKGPYDVIHLACHGRFREDNPDYSSLTFGDGSLTANAMRALDLDASLITLSACESGTSAVAGGDELLGLVRGFLSAGARSLLVSLWRTDDFYTAELMLAFYEHWRAGATRAEALREAQAHVREQAPHPYFWAPFVLIGSGG
ncbi:MAG: CHAT domain-containing tetratricopeptide repeat protein [Candidatus Latescibacterota bacterium]